eukprot:CAMPEP_0172405250 /NCGR_PEP_ID=MMETSP1061-20121228/66494_1 /TAXON_ID=37318 /ORGANISM="Pseudo-nitzschia pungens, Strain cf. pungens" /LENGTH=207 /DNA_ID=CAMNT_0013140419 /DNA_START=110 /DNA_END=729 /DNA_ORIENTATION=-
MPRNQKRCRNFFLPRRKNTGSDQCTIHITIAHGTKHTAHSTHHSSLLRCRRGVEFGKTHPLGTVPALFHPFLLLDPVLHRPVQGSTQLGQQVFGVQDAIVVVVEFLEIIDEADPAADLGRHNDPADHLEKRHKDGRGAADVNGLELDRQVPVQAEEALGHLEAGVLVLVKPTQIVNHRYPVLLCLGSLHKLIQCVIQHPDDALYGSA